jgi:hypothetical protein
MVLSQKVVRRRPVGLELTAMISPVISAKKGAGFISMREVGYKSLGLGQKIGSFNTFIMFYHESR